MTELFMLALLGGALTAESTAVGQFMLSRPIVSGTLAGWVVGLPALGFAVGMLLELYLLVAFPVGGARFPEGAPATIVAVAGSAVGGGGALAVGVAIGLLWGQLCGVAASTTRTVNSELLARRSPAASRLGLWHLVTTANEFGRGVIMTFLGVAVVRSASRSLGVFWPLDFDGTMALLTLGGFVSLGILIRSFGGARRRGGLVGVGLVFGVLGALAF